MSVACELGCELGCKLGIPGIRRLDYHIEQSGKSVSVRLAWNS